MWWFNLILRYGCLAIIGLILGWYLIPFKPFITIVVLIVIFGNTRNPFEHGS